MHRPERLWDQYLGKANAEASRGMGDWPLQPHPVALEPPWDRYDRACVTLWDCLLHGWEGPWEGGGWLRQAFSADQPLLQQGHPILLPECPSGGWPEMVPIVIEQFPDDESTIPKTDEFLRTLPRLHRPVSFEVIGMGPTPKYDHEKGFAAATAPKEERKRKWAEAITGWTEPYTLVQFMAHRDDAPRIERQLNAHFPNSSVVRGEDLNDDHDRVAGYAIDKHGAFAATLSLQHFHYFPLRVFTRLDQDPLGVAIAAMEELGRGEWAILQVLFERTTAPWGDTLAEALVNPYAAKEFLFPEVTERMVKEKFGTPLFAVSIRIAAKTRDVFRQLEGWAEQFTTPPQGLELNQQEWENGSPPWYERETLGSSIDHRYTHRPGLLLNIQELASLIHLPGRGVASERLRRVKSRTKAAVEVPSDDGSVVLGENVHRGKTRIARVPAQLRSRHCYVAGASGTGKSTLLLNLILQDVEAGRGVGVLDPHGDLINNVLRRIPEHRIDDVILFDPADEEYPFALNILDAKDANERERIVAETVMALERYFPASWGPRLERILTFTLYTVLDAIPGATLADVERMLTDKKFREQTVAKTRDVRFVDFWKNQFTHMPGNAVDPVLNKLSVFLINRTVRNIICQRRSAIDFDKLLNDGKILLANLSTGLLTEKIAGMVGSFLVTKIVNAAFRRARLPENQRRPWYLYVDEFQSFMNLSVGFDRILAEARKYNLVLAGLANQYVGQLTPQVRQSIFGNVGTMAFFRLGVDDATLISRELGVFTSEEILNLDIGQAIVRAGGSQSAFNVQTSPPPPTNGLDPTAMIRRRTRGDFSRSRKEVEASFGGIGDTIEPQGTGRFDDEPRDPDEDDFVT